MWEAIYSGTFSAFSQSYFLFVTRRDKSAIIYKTWIMKNDKNATYIKGLSHFMGIA